MSAPAVAPPAGSDERRAHAGVGPKRLAAFAVLAAACALGIVAVAASMVDPRTDPDGGEPTAVAPGELSAIRDGAHLTVRSAALGSSFGAVAIAPLGADGVPSGALRPTDLRCDRVAEAADRGLCLVADRGAFTTYRALVVDRDGRTLFTLDLAGEPSRARVSPDGDLGAATVFVSGHSYAQAGFSTSTTIIDLRTGTALGDLEQFELRRDGALVDAADRNFWGVTFAADGTTFYATAATGGETFLVRGDLPSRTMATVRSGVECPSLSPDGRRIAFKQRRVGDLGLVEWRLAVLDLASGSVVETAEARSIDDQPAWLDDDTVLYGLPRDDASTPSTDVWAVPADGTGAPTRLVESAWSPSVVAPEGR